MKIVVLIKQVPMAWAMALDPETRTLKREGVKLELSSFDVRALLKAFELRDEHGGEVVALTMGPPQAREALEYCLALGADRAVQLCDPAFAGADTLATARALARAIEREGCDLVLCGRHSTDAETGQVGPEVAELLDFPQVTGARVLEVDLAAREITVEREVDDGTETVECPLPALVSATEDLAPERFAKKADRERAKEMPVTVVGAADLSPNLSIFGAAGSPTWVESIETVEVERRQRLLEGELDDQIEALVELLLDHGLYGTWRDGDEASASPPQVERALAGGQAVWVVAETLGGELRPVTFELLGKAAELASTTHGEVAAVLPGEGLNRHVAALGAYGADVVYLADDPRLAGGGTEVVTALLAAAIRRHRPRVVLFGSTAAGRDVAPRLAARLGLGLTGDCIDLEIDLGGRLVQYKPAFGGNVVAPIFSRTSPEMATVRPGMLKAPAPAADREARLVRLDVSRLPADRVRVVTRARSDVAAAALDHAEIVVGVGKGIGGPEALGTIGELAAVLDAAPLAATRTVCDLGWLPRQRQVGLTGRAIAPRLYFAVALRGALEHTVGIRNAGLVVAINDRRRSPIFKQADVGIVGDWAEVVPRLTRALASARG